MKNKLNHFQWLDETLKYLNGKEGKSDKNLLREMEISHTPSIQFSENDMRAIILKLETDAMVFRDEHNLIRISIDGMMLCKNGGYVVKVQNEQDEKDREYKKVFKAAIIGALSGALLTGFISWLNKSAPQSIQLSPTVLPNIQIVRDTVKVTDTIFLQANQMRR